MVKLAELVILVYLAVLGPLVLMDQKDSRVMLDHVVPLVPKDSKELQEKLLVHYDYIV